VTGLPERIITHFLKSELLADFSGQLLSINNCVECVTIQRVGLAGQTLRLGMLAAAPALLRVQQRQAERLLGTQNRLKLMVFSFDRTRTRGRGYSPGRTTINVTFCAPTELSDVMAVRISAKDDVVQQVFAVDAAIEAIVSKL
jgi:hypothetical protein